MSNNQTTGRVYLIGAGPGDPKLITIKGRQCIREADVVVYDYLANPRLLSEAKPGAEKIYVGKRAHDHTAEQNEINQLLVDQARLGRTVARLKGGDAFIFGRGGEEALFLAENGIPFEVVPGVSSAYAVPAYAGIPVTHRGIAADVAFITGHEQTGAGGPGVSWETLAKSAGTLVFLMGVKNLDNIISQLLAQGKAADTPVAVIRWGTMSDQETITGTMSDIVAMVEAADFRPPAVIVIGEVVRLREKLAWFESKPLFGQRVLVTRAVGQAGALAAALEDAGAEVMEFPTIEIRPVDDHSMIDEAIDKMAAAERGDAAYDWLIFTSANTIHYFIERLKGKGQDIRVTAGAKLAAVGTATAAALEEAGLLADFVPGDYRAEGLIDEFSLRGVGGQRILIPRALEARGILPRRLGELGAEVTVAPVYQNVPADPPVESLKEELKAGRINCVTFTSGSTVKNFARLATADGDLSDLLAGVGIATIGPITAKAATKAGLVVDVMPAESTIPALVKAIIEGESERRRKQ